MRAPGLVPKSKPAVGFTAVLKISTTKIVDARK